MQPFIDLASHFGLPVGMLVIFALYHARVVKEKDAEIARVNEKRVEESKELSDKILGRDKEHLELMAEVDKTLSLLSERIR